MAVTQSRRTFLKVGFIGAIALATAGGLYRAMQAPVTPPHFILDSKARSALSAIIGVMLKEAITPTQQAMDAAIARVLDTIAALPLVTQKEIQDLFGLLTLGPTRRFLAGVPDEWHEAKPDDVAAFLQSWRVHRFAMLQGAYHALHDLIFAGWYVDESTWAAIGYPGPMKI